MGTFLLSLRALWSKAWSRRTTITGYLGVAFGAVQAAQGGSVKCLILAVIVACLGHYNHAVMNETPQ